MNWYDDHNILKQGRFKGRQMTSTQQSTASSSEARGETLRLGTVTYAPLPNGLRSIRCSGVEAVRSLEFLVRDSSWATTPLRTRPHGFSTQTNLHTFGFDFSALDGSIDGTVRFEVGTGGLTARFEGHVLSDVELNRIGFVLLSPLVDVVGKPLRITHSDGQTETTEFPQAVMPSQPATDIVVMEHSVGPVELRIEFSGDLFEMEDQRNWTDASFKTYSRPLSLGFPYRIAAGETIRQSVTLAVRESGSSTATKPEPAARPVTLPEIGLVAENGWDDPDDTAAAITAIAPAHVIWRSPEPQDGVPDHLVGATPLDLEIVLPEGTEPGDVSKFAVALSDRGIRPRRVFALPEPYLKSYQPDGDWPLGTTPEEAADWARTAFPEAEIGAGMLTNFTELNRCPPRSDQVDFVSHSTTAIVHAADDVSVMETLEALPQVFASARTIADGLPLCLGLVSIGMRTNPYGAGTVANPGGEKIAMAMDDPRQWTRFGAAFALGAYAAAAEAGVASLSLASVAGPFGVTRIADGKREYSPLCHLLGFLSKHGGKAGEVIGALPHGIVGVSLEGGAVFANCGLSPANLQTADKGRFWHFDANAEARTRGTPNWRVALSPKDSGMVQLQPFDLVFQELEDGA
ncbi:hypothetical protein R5H30_18150 [Sulfitobacter sp. D35]|uniref:hypothetical protein n=1 Tax=Sulfitobacter sp. D35 TaxID=3083252 RepID=UPI00296EAEE6|nr:hypothetical protein [Sulfitobacter sp. D35]MDW4499920.1 hypothetical protein [Sulfitobacter sp. D35]